MYCQYIQCVYYNMAVIRLSLEDSLHRSKHCLLQTYWMPLNAISRAFTSKDSQILLILVIVCVVIRLEPTVLPVFAIHCIDCIHAILETQFWLNSQSNEYPKRPTNKNQILKLWIERWKHLSIDWIVFNWDKLLRKTLRAIKTLNKNFLSFMLWNQ